VSCQLCHYITGHGPECRYFHEEAAADAAELRARVTELESARSFSKVFVVHIYDAADQLHDYYVHQTAEAATRKAACDVVEGRFEDLAPGDFDAEEARVAAAVYK
jgi:hypothetical protein